MEKYNLTEIYGSFSKEPGWFGFTVHNMGFQHHKLNKFYTPFKVLPENLEAAIKSIHALDLKGVGVSSPYKTDVIKYLDVQSDLVARTNSCNTIIKDDEGKLVGFNTDYGSVEKVLRDNNVTSMVIAGSGGYAKTVKCVAEDLGIKYTEVTRKNWHDLSNYDHITIFNATPVVLTQTNAINASIETPMGRLLALYQANMQFKLYTNGYELPIEEVKKALNLD